MGDNPEHDPEEYWRWEVKVISAYNVRTRKKTTIKEPQLITMKNGRKAITGIAEDDGKTKLFRMVSEAEAREFESSK